jgi:replicative DNA helicase
MHDPVNHNEDTRIGVNIDLETALLGVLMCNNSGLGLIAGLVEPQDFYIEKHQQIYAVMLHLYNQYDPIDLEGLEYVLRVRGQLESIGGREYLQKLVSNVNAVAFEFEYAKKVRELSVRRSFLAALEYASKNAKDLEQPVEEAIREMEKQIAFLMAKSVKKDLFQLTDVFEALFKDIEERSHVENEVKAPLTGFQELDRLTGGLNAGDLVVLAGPAGIDRTTMAFSIAEAVFQKYAFPVLYASLELDAIGLARVPISVHSGIKMQTFINPNGPNKITVLDWPLLANAVSIYHQTPMLFLCRHKISILELRRAARYTGFDEEKRQPGLIVVDYIQLMSDMKSPGENGGEITETMRSLKSLARELGVAIIALAQIHRSEGDGAKGRYDMANLHESGATDRYADIVIFMRRSVADGEKDKIELTVAKNNHGDCGSFVLNWDDLSKKQDNTRRKKRKD